MEEEMSQIKNNEAWDLVPHPEDNNIIETKWVFINKMNEDGQIIRNKARLVCKDTRKLKELNLKKLLLQ